MIVMCVHNMYGGYLCHNAYLRSGDSFVDLVLSSYLSLGFGN